jgi:hypothetical protein
MPLRKLPSCGIGLERGRAEGARANAEAMLLRLLAARFSSVDTITRERLAAAPDHEAGPPMTRTSTAREAHHPLRGRGAG